MQKLDNLLFVMAVLNGMTIGIALIMILQSL
jgi:hypothetical protein